MFDIDQTIYSLLYDDNSMNDTFIINLSNSDFYNKNGFNITDFYGSINFNKFSNSILTIYTENGFIDGIVNIGFKTLDVFTYPFLQHENLHESNSVIEDNNNLEVSEDNNNIIYESEEDTTLEEYEFVINI